MIYFMQAGESGHVKIGWTANARTLKLRQATLQGAHFHSLTVIRTIADAPKWGERWLHNAFSDIRTGGEWFTYQPEMLTINIPETQPGGESNGIGRLSKAIQLRIAPEELAALDAYCAEGRRVTGEPFARTEVIRLAVAKLVSEPKRLAREAALSGSPISPNKALDVLLGRSTDTPLVEDCVTTDPPKHDLAAQVRTLGADSLLPPDYKPKPKERYQVAPATRAKRTEPDLSAMVLAPSHRGQTIPPPDEGRVE